MAPYERVRVQFLIPARYLRWFVRFVLFFFRISSCACVNCFTCNSCKELVLSNLHTEPNSLVGSILFSYFLLFWLRLYLDSYVCMCAKDIEVTFVCMQVEMPNVSCVAVKCSNMEGHLWLRSAIEIETALLCMTINCQSAAAFNWSFLFIAYLTIEASHIVMQWTFVNLQIHQNYYMMSVFHTIRWSPKNVMLKL